MNGGRQYRMADYVDEVSEREVRGMRRDKYHKQKEVKHAACRKHRK